MDIKRALWKTLSIQRSEIGFALPLFFLYFLSGSFYAVGQIFTETLFLKAYGAKGLSQFFVYNGIALILAGIIYNYILLKVTLKKGYIILIIIFSLLIYLSSNITNADMPWLPFYLYMANYLITFFLDIHFYNYAFQYLSLRSSKRILPVLMGGGKLGGIIASILIFSFFSKDITKFGMKIWMINSLLLIIPIIILDFIIKSKDNKAQVNSSDLLPDIRLIERIINKIKISYSMPIFYYSVLLIFVMSIVNQISEYYFANIFTGSFKTKNELANFLSIYTFIADFVTLFVQLLITSKIIRRLGVKKSNYIYPVSFLSLIIFMIYSPGLIAAILLRFFRKNLGLMFRLPVFNIIMASSPRDKITEVKSFISGIISPLGMIAGGGAILLIYKKLTPEDGYMMAVSAGIIFIILTLLQNRAYIKTLKGQLSYDARSRWENSTELIDHTKLNNYGKNIIGNMSLMEALFNYKPSTEFIPLLMPNYSILSQDTKQNMINLCVDSKCSIKEMAQLALSDDNALLRAKALSIIKDLKFNERKKYLNNITSKMFSSEKYAVSLLLINKEKEYDKIILERDNILSTLDDLKKGILKKKKNPAEFIIFTQVLHPQNYISHLIELAVKTRNIIFLKGIIPISDNLTAAQAVRIFYAYNAAPQNMLIKLVNFSGKINEKAKLLLLDYRKNISLDFMEDLYQKEEESKNIILNRLRKNLSYSTKSNYLKYLIVLNIKPKRHILSFINSEIHRINIILPTIKCINSMKARPGEKIIIKFLTIALKNEMELRKHLILKSIAILSGSKIDEAYESNIFLKDRDLTNIIIEYIESYDKHAKKALYLFDDNPSELLECNIEHTDISNSLKITEIFMPEVSHIINFCSETLLNKAINLKKKIKAISPEEDNMLTQLDKIIFLKENRLFNEINIDDLIHIANITREIELPANKNFIKEGEIGDELFIIVDGEVEVYTKGKILAKYSSGNCIGELSIIDKEPRSANVKTKKKSRILSIKREDFLLTLKENPTLSINIMQIITQRLRSLIP